MKIEVYACQKFNIAEVKTKNIIIHEVQDALDLMADCNYQGASNIIIKKENIIKDFSDITGKSLKDFIYESNSTGRILFVSSLEEAKEKLLK